MTECSLCGHPLPDRDRSKGGRPRERHDFCGEFHTRISQLDRLIDELHRRGITDHSRLLIRRQLFHIVNRFQRSGSRAGTVIPSFNGTL